jgi:hypothetical protein
MKMKNFRNIGQSEIRHRKYKRLKLGGGNVYVLSSDWMLLQQEF